VAEGKLLAGIWR